MFERSIGQRFSIGWWKLENRRRTWMGKKTNLKLNIEHKVHQQHCVIAWMHYGDFLPGEHINTQKKLKWKLKWKPTRWRKKSNMEFHKYIFEQIELCASFESFLKSKQSSDNNRTPNICSSRIQWKKHLCFSVFVPKKKEDK